MKIVGRRILCDAVMILCVAFFEGMAPIGQTIERSKEACTDDFNLCFG
jgi:hypothetical protein